MIQVPVVYSDKSKEVVDKYEADQKLQHQDYWLEKEVSPIRAEIKNHYKLEQNYTCVYCNKKISVKHSAAWDAEHIVARENSPQFMFAPENLCVACKDCNGPKSNQNVLANRDRKKYPTCSEDFLVVHPHFDYYKDHIAIFLDSIYSPKTKKGQKTIELCNLLRFAYESVGWEAEISKSPEIVQIASDLLHDETTDKEKLSMELLMKTQLSLSNTLIKRD
jgi:5-methylcytosine-specific restriction endonuclease McrA